MVKSKKSNPRVKLLFTVSEFKELGFVRVTPAKAAEMLWNCSASSLNRKIRSHTVGEEFTHRGVKFKIVDYL